MSDSGGVRQWTFGRLVLAGVFLAGGMAGCTYEADGVTRPVTEAPPAGSPPDAGDMHTKPPELVDLEASNRAELARLLGTPPQGTFLDVAEPIGGGIMSFVVTGHIPAAGNYDVTTNCLGTPNAKVFLKQESQTEDRLSLTFAFDCQETTSRVVQLRAGSVTVDAMNATPDESEWGTGAIAAVRITASKP